MHHTEFELKFANANEQQFHTALILISTIFIKKTHLNFRDLIFSMISDSE